jgi:hypothetical protein
MAMRTISNRWKMFTFFKMTYKTGTLCDSYVLSLNDLGMTAGALESLPSFQVLEMNLVVEADFLIIHFSF